VSSNRDFGSGGTWHGPQHSAPVRPVRGAAVLGGRRRAVAAGRRRRHRRPPGHTVEKRHRLDQHVADGRARRPAQADSTRAGLRAPVAAAARGRGPERRRPFVGDRRRRRPRACRAPPLPQGLADRRRGPVRAAQVRTAGGEVRKRRERIRHGGRRAAPHRLDGRELLRHRHVRGPRVPGAKVGAPRRRNNPNKNTPPTPCDEPLSVKNKKSSDLAVVFGWVTVLKGSVTV